jgi:hypothetical protein
VRVVVPRHGRAQLVAREDPVAPPIRAICSPEWKAGPPASFRKMCGRASASTSSPGCESVFSAAAIQGQLERTKDLYLLGDLSREQYQARKRVLTGELATLEPPILSDVEKAAAALANFAWFWQQETNPTERNTLLRLIFDHVTIDDGQIQPGRRG